MAVGAFYPGQTIPQVSTDFLGKYLNAWVNQRAGENQAARAAMVGEDPSKLGQLEQQVVANLGKLAEARGKTMSARDIEKMKSDATAFQALAGYMGRVASAQGSVASARTRTAGSLKSSEIGAFEDRQKAMKLTDDSVGFLSGAAQEAGQVGDPDAKNAAIDRGINAALADNKVASKSGDPKADNVYFTMYRQLADAGDTEGAAYVRGRYFGNRAPEAVFDERYGMVPTTDQNAEIRDVLNMGGGVGADAWLVGKGRALIEGAEPAMRETETMRSEKGSGGGGGGSAPTMRTRTTVSLPAGSVTVDTTDPSALFDRAAAGDASAKQTINDGLDDAIAEQRALLADIRDRRQKALARSGSGMPTGNWLIGNPNTYVEPPSFQQAPDVVKAALGERTPPIRPGEVFTPVDAEAPAFATPDDVDAYYTSAIKDATDKKDDAEVARLKKTRQAKILGVSPYELDTFMGTPSPTGDATEAE